jgi:hypothetical protein
MMLRQNSTRVAADVYQESKDATLRWLLQHLEAALQEADDIAAVLLDLPASDPPAPDGKNLVMVLQERLGQLEVTIDWALARVEAVHPAAPKPASKPAH